MVPRVEHVLGNSAASHAVLADVLDGLGQLHLLTLEVGVRDFICPLVESECIDKHLDGF